METSALKAVWETELQILDLIDDICRKNNLKYSLAYGTLIGAIRHHGFIPWDDDIDICMPREDYNRFIECWNQSHIDGYKLENKDFVFDFTQSFTKIIKDHTTFLQANEDRTKSFHKGIFVDIFPGDRVPNGRIAKSFQYMWFAVALLFSRNHPSGSSGLIGLIERVLLCLPEKYHPRIRKFAEKQSQKWNADTSLPIVFANTIQAARIIYKADLFDHLMTAEFEKGRYAVFAEYDSFLRICYGDYMQLPPPEERTWKHHPLLIDFERNYEEIPVEEQI